MESDSDAEFENEKKQDFSSKQEFNKIERHLLSTGYREGVAAGKDASFQSGFDTGFAKGFETAFSLGKFNGVMEALKRNATSLSLDPQEFEGCSFENARHGLCQVCTADQQQSECGCKEAKEVSQLLDRQQKHSATVFEGCTAKYLHILQGVGLADVLLRKSNQS